ncbi:MAG: hypothetical protein RIS44_1218 [Pseudomonadota bacterium]|jgi:hypothetical protein
MITRRTILNAASAAVLTLTAPMVALAAELPADIAAKVEKAKKRMTEIAADPALVAAVREANGKDTGGMNNGKWSDLPDADPMVKAMLTTKASTLIAKLESSDDTVNKLLLRDQKGNLVAASTKPLLFNNASRPVFMNPLKGQPWAADKVQPDTTTQVPSVHVGVPVLDGGKPIGVLHAAVTAQ